MKTILAAAALALISAAPAWSDDAAADSGPAWFNAVADQKLIAVDGASILLSSADNKMTLTMASAAGGAQKRVYALMSDNMGTVSDDAGRMLGFFRVTDTGLEETFGDGHTEQLTLNGYGGLSLTAHNDGATTCMAWYPAGHTFSEAERRAAVADYASRLGLVEHHIASVPTGPIMVHTVTVHTIDPPVSIAPAKAGWSATAHTAQNDAPQPGHGASDCLHVESDGANLGFRNQCGYGVQFAYCLQTSAETDANCGVGAKAGNVSANGFTPLLMDTNIKAADAEHDFRWVACSGAAGEVTPQLDRPDPPAGRCLLKRS